MKKCRMSTKEGQCENKVFKQELCKTHFKEVEEFVKLLNNELKNLTPEFLEGFNKALSESLEERLEAKIIADKFKIKH